MAGIKLNQNIKIMDRKVLKDTSALMWQSTDSSMTTELRPTWMSLMYSLQNQKEMQKIRQMTMRAYGMNGMMIR